MNCKMEGQKHVVLQKSGVSDDLNVVNVVKVESAFTHLTMVKTTENQVRNRIASPFRSLRVHPL